LNRAIEKHGAETIYILQNGESYILDWRIQYTHPLRIHAAKYPSDNPPIIRPKADFMGIFYDVARFYDDVEIIGVYLNAMDDFGSMGENMTFVKEGIRGVFRHCYFSASGYSLFDLRADNISIRIEDSQIRDAGRSGGPNYNRFLNMRGHDVDSIIVINSSLYQIASDIVRTVDGTVDYLEFNHVTIANHLRNPLDLGRARQAIIRNSLFINTGADGVWESKELTGQAGHAYNGERYYDTGGLIRVASYEDHPDKVDGSDEQRRIVIRNNNFGGLPDSMFIDLWQKMSEDDPERDFGRGRRTPPVDHRSAVAVGEPICETRRSAVGRARHHPADPHPYRPDGFAPAGLGEGRGPLGAYRQKPRRTGVLLPIRPSTGEWPTTATPAGLRAAFCGTSTAGIRLSQTPATGFIIPVPERPPIRQARQRPGGGT
jgi:hypothetical protein